MIQINEFWFNVFEQQPVPWSSGYKLESLHQYERSLEVVEMIEFWVVRSRKAKSIVIGFQSSAIAVGRIWSPDSINFVWSDMLR